MNTSVSISQLKVNPAKFIFQSVDYPVPVVKRGQVKAYLIGKELYEKLITYIEDLVDKKEIENADYDKRIDFEKIAKKLNI